MATNNSEEEFENISKEEIEQLKREAEKSGLSSFDDFINRKLEELSTIKVRIGVTGITGSGKSTLINALRDLMDEDQGAAPVDVTQTTMAPTEYADVQNNNLVYVDLPGIGTHEFPKETYLEKIRFKQYNAFIIVSGNKFSNLEKFVAIEVQKQKKLFYFVRTKVQQTLDGKRNGRRDKTINEEDEMLKIRNEIKSNLEEMYEEESCFLIDSHYKNNFQFNNMKEKIYIDLPANIRSVLAHMIQTGGTKVLEKKSKDLHDRIKWVALASASLQMSPIPGTSFVGDIALIIREVNFYKMQLGLTEEALKQLAISVGCSEQVSKEMQTLVHKEIGLLTRAGIACFVRSLSIGTIALVAADKMSEFFNLIPGVGYLVGIVTSPLSAYCMHRVLTAYLHKCIDVRAKIQDIISLKVSTKSSLSESAQELATSCERTVIPPEFINKL